jgi:hypothetical protein
VQEKHLIGLDLRSCAMWRLGRQNKGSAHSGFQFNVDAVLNGFCKISDQVKATSGFLHLLRVLRDIKLLSGQHEGPGPPPLQQWNHARKEQGI